MNNYNNVNQPLMHIGRDKRMENAAMTLSVISLISGMVIYISFPCGALAIILALLSKGSTGSITRRAQMAMFIAIGGLILTTGVYAWSFLTLYHQYGSIEGIIKAVYEQAGITY